MPPTTESVEHTTPEDLVEEAGPIGTGYIVVKFLYDFGKTNPIEIAINRISEEIQALQAGLERLESRVAQLEVEDAKTHNLVLVEVLIEQVIELSSLAFKVRSEPGDRVAAAGHAFEAGLRADRFIARPERWKWRDIRTTIVRDANGNPTGPATVEALPPEFKVAVALPVYSLALATWLAAIGTHTAGDRAAVRSIYGEALERHAAFVSVTPGWRDDLSGAVTLPEQVRSRITCQPIAVHPFARNGQCTFTVQCSDELRRTRTVVREFSVEVGRPDESVLCTINPEVVIQDEREVEDADETIRALALWEEILRTMASTGRLPADPFVGTFPSWTAVSTGLYGIDADQNLRYWTQALPGDGSWEHGILVGTGWGFQAEAHLGASRVAGLRDDGEWLWYGHIGADTTPPTDAWTPGWREVGKWDDWGAATADFTYFGGGHGVIYRLTGWVTGGDATEGDLMWTRLGGYLSGARGFMPVHKVGTGWNTFTRIAVMGEAVIYGIYPEGTLCWYKHLDYLTGGQHWSDPVVLYTGVDWSEFAKVIASEGGVLHGVYPNGQMVTYRHLDWATGGPRFEGRVAAADTWRDQLRVFPSISD